MVSKEIGYLGGCLALVTLLAAWNSRTVVDAQQATTPPTVSDGNLLPKAYVWVDSTTGETNKVERPPVLINDPEAFQRNSRIKPP